MYLQKVRNILIQESFDEIEKELIALSKDSNMYSAIVGDFNAKIGTLNDFIIPDETLLDLFYLVHNIFWCTRVSSSVLVLIYVVCL
jgi:hypothetical protein